jgi:putative ABC transport system substrate-binding protein
MAAIAPGDRAPGTTRVAVLVLAPVRNDTEIEETVAALAREPGAAVAVVPIGLNDNTRRGVLIASASRHQLPLIGGPLFAREGGLISLWNDPVDQYAHAASYIDRILKGASPADLPVQQPTKVELVINLKTAKALGLTVPVSLLARADEAIE